MYQPIVIACICFLSAGITVYVEEQEHTCVNVPSPYRLWELEIICILLQGRKDNYSTNQGSLSENLLQQPLLELVPVKKILSPVTPQNFYIQWTFSKDMDCKITSYANELKVAYFKKQWNYYVVS